MINYLSTLIMPLLIFLVILYGIYKKTNVYDDFIDGVKESFSLTKSMFPCLLSMILGINIFVNSGFLSAFLSMFTEIFQFLKIPLDIVPLALMRPISGSSSLALLNDLFINHGPDSYIGRLGSVIQGSTETTFYVLTLYFGSIGIKKIKYALWAGLFADLIGIIVAIIVVKMIF
ncbi:MAG: spore maturation protein [Bacilli bacterium]